MTITMNFFEYDLAETYYTKSLTSGDIWMFLSHGNELIKPSSIAADRIAMEFLEKTVSAVRLYPKDYAFMMPIRFWQQNAIYVEYDDTADLNQQQPYFVAVEPEIESGNYHIFKCIANNYNGKSLEKPAFNSIITNGIYEGGDGYIWKYMTSVPFLEYRKFSARSVMPIFRNRSVELIANTGIYNIKVENRDSNFGYGLFSGEVEKIDTVTNTITIATIRKLANSDGTPSLNQDLNFQIENFFSNRIFRIKSSMTNTILGSRSFKIIKSGVTPELDRYVQLNSVDNIREGDQFEISPEIVISGDGTGAVAVPIFNDERIVSVRMLSYGNGYKTASATVTPPTFGFSAEKGAITAELRPIVSPNGGHGSNIIRELNSRSISVSTTVSSRESSKIPATGSYSKIGLVKYPKFNQTAVFTRRNTTVVQKKTNSITLNNVVGIVNGMSVSFGNAIPPNTLITSIVDNTITLSSNVESDIISESDIIVSSVLGTFDNRIRVVAAELPGALQPGEIVTQGSVKAVIHSINFNTREIYLIEYNGDFSNKIVSSEPIVTRLGSIGINTIEYSPYEQKTGEVLYISDVTPIFRELDKVEQLRVIIQF